MALVLPVPAPEPRCCLKRSKRQGRNVCAGEPHAVSSGFSTCIILRLALSGAEGGVFSTETIKLSFLARERADPLLILLVLLTTVGLAVSCAFVLGEETCGLLGCSAFTGGMSMGAAAREVLCLCCVFSSLFNPYVDLGLFVKRLIPAHAVAAGSVL